MEWYFFVVRIKYLSSKIKIESQTTRGADKLNFIRRQLSYFAEFNMLLYAFGVIIRIASIFCKGLESSTSSSKSLLASPKLIIDSCSPI